MMMQAGIRIIKRGAQSGRSELSADHVVKSDRERERETVNTVKAWVADWETRRRSPRNTNKAIRSSELIEAKNEVDEHYEDISTTGAGTKEAARQSTYRARA